MLEIIMLIAFVKSIAGKSSEMGYGSMIGGLAGLVGLGIAYLFGFMVGFMIHGAPMGPMDFLVFYIYVVPSVIGMWILMSVVMGMMPAAGASKTPVELPARGSKLRGQRDW